jgi:hypothetical protein
MMLLLLLQAAWSHHRHACWSLLRPKIRVVTARSCFKANSTGCVSACEANKSRDCSVLGTAAGMPSAARREHPSKLQGLLDMHGRMLYLCML